DAWSGAGVLPDETVGVGERTEAADEGQPVRTGARRIDARVLRGRAATVQRQLDRGFRRGEFDVFAAEAPRHGQPALDIELLGRLDLVDAEEHDEIIDFPVRGTGVLLRRA